MLIALETAKQYLRVDSSDDDTLITSLLESAEKMCLDVLRVEDSDEPLPKQMELAVLYATAYMYEHREDANMGQMMITLRHLLGADRKEVF